MMHIRSTITRAAAAVALAAPPRRAPYAGRDRDLGADRPGTSRVTGRSRHVRQRSFYRPTTAVAWSPNTNGDGSHSAMKFRGEPALELHRGLQPADRLVGQDEIERPGDSRRAAAPS
jgi:hypothetical protein